MLDKRESPGSVAVMEPQTVPAVDIVECAVVASAINNPDAMSASDTSLWYRREATKLLARAAAAGSVERVLEAVDTNLNDNPQVAYAVGINILRNLTNGENSRLKIRARARSRVASFLASILDKDNELPEQQQTFVSSDRELFTSVASIDPAELDEWAWSPCSTCFGQRRTLKKSANGEGLVPTACSDCLAIGEQFKP